MLLSGTSLTAAGLDSNTCVSSGDTFSELVTGSENRLVVATHASGGLTNGDGALAVWAEAGNVYAQRLVNHANGGALVDLGGGCGSGGTQSFSHNPAIGSSGFRCSVNGLPFGAPTIFNFSAPAPAVPCGGCSWLPFAVTLTPPTALGSAWVEFPIPSQPSLVGAQSETQWTTIDPPQAPCPLLPGFVLSNRVRLTIGQ
jgi:hypothetical protein